MQWIRKVAAQHGLMQWIGKLTLIVYFQSQFSCEVEGILFDVIFKELNEWRRLFNKQSMELQH